MSGAPGPTVCAIDFTPAWFRARRGFLGQIHYASPGDEKLR
jgi:hypothetical protein